MASSHQYELIGICQWGLNFTRRRLCDQERGVNNNKTVITFREGPEVVRFRTPEDPLATLDRAIARVDAKRSLLGALDHRLDAVITQQIEHSTHLTAAKSRIEDADYALEVVNLTRAQILQQVSVTTLAQSNLSFQSVLALLR